jgi:hypothetical protein
VSFLRRLLGGAPEASAAEGAGRGDEGGSGDTVAEEQARERELLLADARRLDDDLLQRQLRYADRSWTPPAQGGTRRADDEDAERE